jgi:hypothetical protein
MKQYIALVHTHTHIRTTKLPHYIYIYIYVWGVAYVTRMLAYV